MLFNTSDALNSFPVRNIRPVTMDSACVSPGRHSRRLTRRLPYPSRTRWCSQCFWNEPGRLHQQHSSPDQCYRSHQHFNSCQCALFTLDPFWRPCLCLPKPIQDFSFPCPLYARSYDSNPQRFPCTFVRYIPAHFSACYSKIPSSPNIGKTYTERATRAKLNCRFWQGLRGLFSISHRSDFKLLLLSALLAIQVILYFCPQSTKKTFNIFIHILWRPAVLHLYTPS